MAAAAVWSNGKSTVTMVSAEAAGRHQVVASFVLDPTGVTRWLDPVGQWQIGGVGGAVGRAVSLADDPEQLRSAPRQVGSRRWAIRRLTPSGPLLIEGPEQLRDHREHGPDRTGAGLGKANRGVLPGEQVGEPEQDAGAEQQWRHPDQ